MRKYLWAILLLPFIHVAHAQLTGPVQWLGNVTPGNCTKWSSPGYVEDSGGPCGGTGAPGGSNYSIQYNNVGSFGGVLPGTTGIYCLDWTSLSAAPTLTTCPGGSSAVSSVTAGSSGDLTASPTTGAVVVDMASQAAGTVIANLGSSAGIPVANTLSALQSAINGSVSQYAGPILSSATVADWDPSILSTPTAVSATATAGGTGNLAAGTYYYEIACTNVRGTTLLSNEVSATLSATGYIQVVWTPGVAGCTGYQVWRGTATGAENLYYAVAAALPQYTDDGSTPTCSSSCTVPSSNTTGGGVQTTGVAIIAANQNTTVYGMLAGADQQQMILFNDSSYTLTLPNESASETTVANQFIEPSAGLAIQPNARAVCTYLGSVLSKWNCQ